MKIALLICFLVSVILGLLMSYFLYEKPKETRKLFLKSKPQYFLNKRQNETFDSIKEQESTANIRVVEIDFSSFVFSEIELNGSKFRLKSKKDIGDNGFSWVGVDNKDNSISLIVFKDRLTVAGTIHLERDLYFIKPLGDGLNVLVLHNNKFPPN